MKVRRSCDEPSTFLTITADAAAVAAESADRSRPPEAGQRAWPRARSELAALVEDHADLLVWHAFRLLGSMPDAEDVVQDVFIRVFSAGRRDEVASIRAYLYRAVGNACTDFLRSRTRSDRRREPIDIDRLAAAADGPPEAAQAVEESRPDRGPARAAAARAGRGDPAPRLRRPAAGRDRRGPRLPDQHRQLPPALRLPEAARGGRTGRSKPMNCQECRQWIDDLLLRDPDEAPPADVAEHLAGCDDCAREHALALETLEAITPAGSRRSPRRDSRSGIMAAIPVATLAEAPAETAGRCRAAVRHGRAAGPMALAIAAGRRRAAGDDPLPVRRRTPAAVEAAARSSLLAQASAAEARLFAADDVVGLASEIVVEPVPDAALAEARWLPLVSIGADGKAAIPPVEARGRSRGGLHGPRRVVVRPRDPSLRARPDASRAGRCSPTPTTAAPSTCWRSTSRAGPGSRTSRSRPGSSRRRTPREFLGIFAVREGRLEGSIPAGPTASATRARPSSPTGPRPTCCG